MEDGILIPPLIKNIFIDMNLRVKYLIDRSTRGWNRAKLNELFYSDDVQLIVKKKQVIMQPDYWCWKHNRSGAYSVKSGYWLVN